MCPNVHVRPNVPGAPDGYAVLDLTRRFRCRVEGLTTISRIANSVADSEQLKSRGRSRHVLLTLENVSCVRDVRVVYATELQGALRRSRRTTIIDVGKRNKKKKCVRLTSGLKTLTCRSSWRFDVFSSTRINFERKTGRGREIAKHVFRMRLEVRIHADV